MASLSAPLVASVPEASSVTSPVSVQRLTASLSLPVVETELTSARMSDCRACSRMAVAKSPVVETAPWLIREMSPPVSAVSALIP
ncbi:hypothetical protein D3C86_1293860 [compost metagenome]